MRYLIILSVFVVQIFCVSVSGQTIEKKATPKNTGSELSFEKRLLAELNAARSSPNEYLKKLEHQKTLISGKVLSVPGRPDVLMNEGIPAVDGAIEALKSTTALGKLKISSGLMKVANAQFSDLKEDPSLGHYGKDGSDLTARLNKFGVAGGAAENITNWETTPDQVSISMLIDDGVPGRHHRQNVLNPKFSLFGASCGKVNSSKFICVVVFADKFVEGGKRLRSY
ncbi:MAG: CAP domain-containing protein [Acidobacteria bacterium]|nr:CAP domain-containing protein [Acidobacteriota bacterium]